MSYKRTIEDLRTWIRGADLRNEEFKNKINSLTPEEVQFFYNVYMMYTMRSNQEFIKFVNDYKEYGK